MMQVLKIKGFSLIEVMVALFILSVGLLSFSQSQLMALRTSKLAYFINVADLKNNSVAEAMQRCNNPSCIQTQLALGDENITKTFPEGEARLSKQGNAYQHTINWHSVYSQVKSTFSLQLLYPA